MTARTSSVAIAGRTAATLATGALGGWLASHIGIPLPWMIGSLLAVGSVALSGVTVIGHGVHVPQLLRSIMIPVVGVMIGGAFTPEVVTQIPEWWITMLGLVFFILVSTGAIYTLYRKAFGYDPATAFFSAIPGGLVEMSIIGEECGGDSRTISLVHFSRIVLAVLIIPFAMRAFYGPVGSAVLDSLHFGGELHYLDVLLLLGAGIVGAVGAKAIRLPGAMISGPMLLSAAIHASGFTSAVPPNWLIFTAQLVVGAALGARFAGITLRQLGRIVFSAVSAILLVLTITVGLSLALVSFVDEQLTALILAYAPGGFAEMSLIALSLNIGVAFVAAHHMARIVLAVMLMPAIWRKWLAPPQSRAMAKARQRPPEDS